jgi:group I intron endonuclease
MFYLIYKITNKLDGKIYIGSHKTKNIDDGYMGSGKYLNRAYQKYGIENFTKEILFVFDNANEMYAKEAELVNEEFLAEANTYNLKRGGMGGFDFINENKLNLANQIKATLAAQKANKGRPGRPMSEEHKRRLAEINKIRPGPFLGRTHSIETIQKMQKSRKGTGIGKTNSQYGTFWITNGINNLKIKKDTRIPDGYFKGRILNEK